MERPGGLIAVAVAILLPAFGADALAQASKSPPGRASQPPVVIQGRPLAEWIAGLEDKDPVERKWVLRILGRVTRGQAGDGYSLVQDAVRAVMFQDRDLDVRDAAAKCLLRLSRVSEAGPRAGDDPAPMVATTPIRLVDVQGRPVAGAVVSTYFEKNENDDPAAGFHPHGTIESRTSDSRGEASLSLAIYAELDGGGVYAIRQEKDRPLVGVHKVTRAEMGKPVTFTMHPACRVRLRIECPGLRAVEAKYQFELDGSNWWRAAYIMLGDDHKAPRPLFASSMTGELEFLLPPGRFTVEAYGSGTRLALRPVEIQPGHRVRSLGILEVNPDQEAEQGRFVHYHHLGPTDPQAPLDGGAGGGKVLLRPVRGGPVLREAWGSTFDLTFSPDGRLLATAQDYNPAEAKRLGVAPSSNAEPGEVMLWDVPAGQLVAAWPVPEEVGGVRRLAFAPDGKTIAGVVGAVHRPQSPWVVVLWDVDGRRAPRTLGGHTGRIGAVVFAPDGKTLASGGTDRTVRFWDVASGQPRGRIEVEPEWPQAIAYAPDGKTLAVGSGDALKLWDIPGNHIRAVLEPGGFLARAVNFAPDGRTLAAAGEGRGRQALVRLYDMAKAPPAHRADLTLDRGGTPPANPAADSFSDVAFTPDGRRVVAVTTSSIVTWEAATGTQQDFVERRWGGPEDHLDVSPDGRWLAVMEGPRAALIDIGPTIRPAP